MRVLVVEDDELFGSAVHKSLMREGYAVDWIRKGRDLTIAMHTHKYDCVLMDLGLPDVSGESLLSVVRHRDPAISVVVTPIDLDELCARVRAVSRRAPSAAAGGELEHGPLKLFPARHGVTWHEQPVVVTRKEYWLLETFVRKKNQVLTRAQLEEALYGWGEEVGSNAVEVYIHYLRRKFGSTVILTVRGVGYQLGAEDTLP